MPENIEPEQQVDEQPQETDSAPEAEVAEEEPFDRARAEAKIKKANSEAENLRKRLKELQPLAKRAQEQEDAQKSEAERLTGQLAEAQERAEKAIRGAVASKVEALASADFADPEDAAGALDLTAYVDDDGVIDTDAIKADLATLLKRKPHWGKPDEGPRSPRPDRTQGSSGNGNRTSSDPGVIFAGLMNEALKGR
jgi:membrane protein involved in colicin uptake